MTSPFSATRPVCVKCEKKNVGISRCEGCYDVFCSTHLMQHRNLLKEQLDLIMKNYGNLRRTVDEQVKGIDSTSIFDQINEWENVSIEKIKQAAETARLEAKKSTNLQSVITQLDNLGENIRISRQGDGFIETDLQSWTRALESLKNDANEISTAISIKENPNEVLVANINIKRETEKYQPEDRFGVFYGPVLIENDGFMAIHNGSDNSTAYVSGTSEYLSGKHTVRLSFKKKAKDYMIGFYIVSGLVPINKTLESIYEIYGWSSDDDIYGFGNEKSIAANVPDFRGKATIEIQLEIDCDNQKISYVNQETNKRKELNVDIKKCPFPWQVRFYFYVPGDCIRIIV